MSRNPTDPDATIPHLFDDEPPIKVRYKTAERIASECQLPNAVSLHQALQRWVDLYYASEPAFKIEPVNPQKEDASRVFGTIRKMLEYSQESETRASRRFRFFFEALEKNSSRDQEPLKYEELAGKLKYALAMAEADFEDWRQFRIEAENDLRRMPKYLPLRFLFREIGFYWESIRSEVKNTKFKFYVPDSTGEPGNQATKLVLESAKVVVPELSQSTILSQWKKYSLDSTINGPWSKIFISHYEP